jgi:hypothetical protein
MKLYHAQHKRYFVFMERKSLYHHSIQIYIVASSQKLFLFSEVYFWSCLSHQSFAQKFTVNDKLSGTFLLDWFQSIEFLVQIFYFFSVSYKTFFSDFRRDLLVPLLFIHRFAWKTSYDNKKSLYI